MKIRVLPVFIGLFCSASHAAERIDLNELVLPKTTESFLQQDIVKYLGLSEEHALKVRHVFREDNGSVTTRYTQLYKGVPVIGDDVIISSDKESEITFGHGTALANIERDIVDVSPTIAYQQAIDIAKEHTLSKPTKPELGFYGHSFTKENPHVGYTNEQGKLAIYEDDSGKARLVYEVSYIYKGLFHNTVPIVYVDAKSGEVIFAYDNLQSAKLNIVGATGPGGNEKLGKYEYGKSGLPKLRVDKQGDTCFMRNEYVETYDMNHARPSDKGRIHQFPCYENTHKPINGAYSPLNDAHYFGDLTFKMFNEYLKMSPLKTKLKIKVHLSNNYENAIWDGTSLSFGDGADRFYPLVSLDIVSHEVAHGFTQRYSNLFYRNQSGGLNESFSDIAGEAAEYFKFGKVDFRSGEDIVKTPNTSRNMLNPTQDGKSIDHAKDFRYGMDVHHSSGVYNRAFSLISQKSGWNPKKAFLMFAKANQKYWTVMTDFNKAGIGTLDAACDLGYDVKYVKSVLESVGVVADTSPGRKCAITDPAQQSKLVNNTVMKIAANKGETLAYVFDVPKDANGLEPQHIFFRLKGGRGDADLYVKKGKFPSDSDKDCASSNALSEEKCLLSKDRATSGKYYVLIKATYAFKDVDLIAKYSFKDEFNDQIVELASDLSVAKGKWNHFKTINLPEDYASLRVRLEGGRGDADLYIQHSKSATEEDFKCESADNGNVEYCRVDNPKAGKWHISLKGFEDAGQMRSIIVAEPKYQKP